ncbi:MAG: hypothetical protein ACK5NF_04100 [Bacilli bacterium]
MLEKLTKELQEMITELLDFVFGSTITTITTKILNNAVVDAIIDGILTLTILCLSLAFVINILNYLMKESKKEIVDVIARFVVLCLVSFFIYDFAKIFFSEIISNTVEYITTAGGSGIADGFFKNLIGSIVVPGGGAGLLLLMVVETIFLLIMFIKFTVDLGKYAIQLQVMVFTYFIYAINTLSNGWNELWSFIINILKIIISSFVLSVFMSVGIYLVLSSLGANALTPEGFFNFMVGVIFMMSKKPIETALSNLGLFNSGSSFLATASSSAMLVRNTISVMGSAGK